MVVTNQAADCFYNTAKIITRNNKFPPRFSNVLLLCCSNNQKLPPFETIIGVLRENVHRTTTTKLDFVPADRPPWELIALCLESKQHNHCHNSTQYNLWRFRNQVAPPPIPYKVAVLSRSAAISCGRSSAPRATVAQYDVMISAFNSPQHHHHLVRFSTWLIQKQAALRTFTSISYYFLSIVTGRTAITRSSCSSPQKQAAPPPPQFNSISFVPPPIKRHHHQLNTKLQSFYPASYLCNSGLLENLACFRDIWLANTKSTFQKKKRIIWLLNL